jgi:hypothetical protein
VLPATVSAVAGLHTPFSSSRIIDLATAATALKDPRTKLANERAALARHCNGSSRQSQLAYLRVIFESSSIGV